LEIAGARREPARHGPHRRENEQLFHLLAVCPRCREVGGWLLDLHQYKTLPPVFGSIDAALARSRAEASQLLDELAHLDPPDRLARIHVGRRFMSWGLCELLVRKSCQAAPGQAAEAVHLADLSVHVADLIPGGDPFEEKWADSWWEAGTADIGDAFGYEPILLDLKAPLRTAQRRFPEAIKLLDRAIDLFLDGQPEHRDPHLAGRSLISKAFVLIEQGESESVIQALKKANGLIDPVRDPRMVTVFRTHNVSREALAAPPLPGSRPPRNRHRGPGPRHRRLGHPIAPIVTVARPKESLAMHLFEP